MRTKNSIINSLSSLVGNVLSYLIAFIAQALFLRLLGAEYLGLNGLFNNILSMFGIFELGIGNAIVYNMYKPILENNNKRISELLNFYKKSYLIISLIIFVVGISLLPFLKYIVGDLTINVNIYCVYLLFLLSSISTYFIAYKRSILIASQKNYIINIIHSLYIIILNVFQIILLYITHNYYIYLIVKIICQIFENLIISFYVSKKFSYLEKYKFEKLEKNIEKDIFSRVKGLIFHKIGTVIIFGTDNIIISRFLGIITVGIYSNYYAIINAASSLFGQIISSITSSVGNLLVSNSSKEKNFEVFDRIRFFNFCISCLTSVTLLLVLQPFIEIWVGAEFKLDYYIVILIVANYFQKLQRSTYNTFKDSAGIWLEDKFVPLIESILNVVFSIICLKLFGLAGVIMGTIISGLVLWCYSYPKLVYINLFKRTFKDYIFETLKYIFVFIFISLVNYNVIKLFTFKILVIQFIFNLLASIIISSLLIVIIYRKNQNYIYYKKLLFKILKEGKIK